MKKIFKLKCPKCESENVDLEKKVKKVVCKDCGYKSSVKEFIFYMGE